MLRFFCFVFLIYTYCICTLFQSLSTTTTNIPKGLLVCLDFFLETNHEIFSKLGMKLEVNRLIVERIDEARFPVKNLVIRKKLPKFVEKYSYFAETQVH